MHIIIMLNSANIETQPIEFLNHTSVIELMTNHNIIDKKEVKDESYC
jgi:hypothetical protein